MKKFVYLLGIVLSAMVVSCGDTGNSEIDSGNGQSTTLTVTTGNPADITETSVKIPTEVTGNDIAARGVCYSLNTNPTVAGSKVEEGKSPGIGSCTITGLSKGTTYYVRSYATNSEGTTYYGSERSFKTLGEEEQQTGILIATTPVKEITAISASSGGNITSDGGSPLIQKGICWSLNENPTIADSKTEQGAETGTYTSSITGLLGYNTYYVRSYATNNRGTSYGQPISFMTLKDNPIVTTSEVFEITDKTAKCGGTVVNQGDETVTCGVCWSLTEHPTVSDSKTTDQLVEGKFVSSLTGLEPNIKYYVRSYATNSVGTVYGEQVEFTAIKGLPVVQTGEVTEISGTSVKCSGTIEYTGGDVITSCGVCWSESLNPTINDSKTTINNPTENNFTSAISELKNGTTYYIRAYATHSIGTGYGEQKTFTTIDGLNFPDANFKNSLISQFDANHDGEITLNEIQHVTTLDVSYKNILSLEGIQYFTALTHLDCHNNQLTILDISKCTKLTRLDCSYNQLTILDVLNCPELTNLYCNDNQLTILDISKCTELTYLGCSSNQLTVLDVSKCTELTYLGCGGVNQFTTLDVSKCTKLTYLDCYLSQLTSLDVSKCTKLTSLWCFGFQLKSLNAAGCTELTTLNCQNAIANGGQLTSLDVSGCTALTGLNCRYHQLTFLNVSGCTALTSLGCGGNQLTSLDVSSCTELTGLDCHNNLLTFLDVSKCTKLINLNSGYHDEYSGLSGGNLLTTLDVSKCTKLTTLYCAFNQLTALDVSNCTELISLQCHDNQITALDVSKCTKLTSLQCHGNQITTLDVSKCTKLTGYRGLECHSNRLTTLDVSGCTELTMLNCRDNQLTSLDVSKCTELTYLDCSDNQLMTLDVSDCLKLNQLWCLNNPSLTFLYFKEGQSMFLWKDPHTVIYYKGILVASITLNQTAATILVGGTEQLSVTNVSPSNATNKSVTWSSSNTSRATVDNTGKITVPASATEGTVTVTATANDGSSVTATCIVTVVMPDVDDDGVLINGLTWATRNVDAPGTFAPSPESPGMFYQWNRRTGWPATGTVTGWNSSEQSGNEWAMTNDPCPDGWRVPSYAQLLALCDGSKVSNEWTSANGVNGRKFTDMTSGNTLFLPATGNRNTGTGSLANSGVVGHYWSATASGTTNGYYLRFTNTSVNPSDASSRANGFTVRCVRE